MNFGVDSVSALTMDETTCLLTVQRQDSIRCRYNDATLPCIPRIFITNLNPRRRGAECGSRSALLLPRVPHAATLRRLNVELGARPTVISSSCLCMCYVLCLASGNYVYVSLYI